MEKLDVWRLFRSARSSLRDVAEERKHLFQASVEQAEQLFRAGSEVGYAARPLPVFYGLSQLGRAIAAVAAPPSEEGKLHGHGIRASSLDATELADVTLRNAGTGSFTSLATLLGSSSLHHATRLGELWPMLPFHHQYPLPGGGTRSSLLRRPDMLKRMTPDPAPQGMTNGTVWPIGQDMAERADRAELGQLIGRYPALEGSEIQRQPLSRAPGDDDSFLHIRWQDSSISPARKMLLRMSTHDWVLPSSDLSGQELHPLLAWWTCLFALSMLARYEPSAWMRHIDVDNSAVAVAIEATLDEALTAVPRLAYGTLLSLDP